MDGLAGLLRFVFERAWYFAALTFIFCIAAQFAPGMGVSVPPAVAEWTGFGLLASSSILVLHVTSALAAFVRHSTKAKRDAAFWDRRKAEEARLNFSSLTLEEYATLDNLLKMDHPARFEVHILSKAYSLIDKGMLRVVKDLGGTSYLCEIEPAVFEDRRDIREALAGILRRN
jgi:hypothetical protein